LEFLEQNESFLNLFGFQEGELNRFELQKLFADSDDYDFCISQLKKHGVIKDFEVRLVTKPGEEKICLFNCIFIPDQEDENCCYQGIIRDLTMSKKAEADMMMAEKLSMTGKLARTIAHEIRNPLTNLNLALDSLQDEVNQSDETLSTYTQIIQRSSNRIESLIGDQLNSSKPKELQLELVSLDSIVQQVMTLVQDRAKLKDIRIEQSLEKGLPRLYVDTEKLSIALVNIFINGIEAIEHSHGLLQVSVSSRQNSIFLRIADNGGGIAKEDLKKIFDPFFTQKSNGTGLGLTSTLNILSSHNALIEVKSTVGEGTVFEIEFPLPEM
jgi:PAS domain S-box